jgi:hypothetical protein
MTRFRYIAAVSVAVLLGALAGCHPGRPIDERVVLFRMGEDSVQVRVFEAAIPGLNMINLHEDEETSVSAALNVMARRGGRLVAVRQQGDRLVRFVLDDSLYAFDPNRIFSDPGIRATLERHGRWSQAGHDLVSAFADTLLAIYEPDRTGLIVAVHNNRPNGYSAAAYLPGEIYESEARFVNLNESHSPDDFFFVTDLDWSRAFVEGRFNVVLQGGESVTEDGSFSIWAARRGIPYINVEAARGNFERQVRMLEYVRERADQEI